MAAAVSKKNIDYHLATYHGQQRRLVRWMGELGVNESVASAGCSSQRRGHQLDLILSVFLPNAAEPPITGEAT